MKSQSQNTAQPLKFISDGTKKSEYVNSVDARGSGYRGKDFKHSTYLQLVKYETIDQISAAKHLGSLSYIDEDKGLLHLPKDDVDSFIGELLKNEASVNLFWTQ